MSFKTYFIFELIVYFKNDSLQFLTFQKVQVFIFILELCNLQIYKKIGIKSII